MNPHTHHAVYSLPPKGVDCRGCMPARAGLDGIRNGRVARQCGLQYLASLGAARREAA